MFLLTALFAGTAANAQSVEWAHEACCFTNNQYGELAVESKLGFRGSKEFRFILKGSTARYFSEELNIRRTGSGEVILRGSFYDFGHEQRISGYWGARSTTNLQFDDQGAHLSADSYNEAD